MRGEDRDRREGEREERKGKERRAIGDRKSKGSIWECLAKAFNYRWVALLPRLRIKIRGDAPVAPCLTSSTCYQTKLGGGLKNLFF